MLTNASKWPSQWWRWTEMRWPASSGSSSKKRWYSGVQESLKRVPVFHRRANPHFLTGLFLYHRRDARGGLCADYLRIMWGSGFVMFHSLTGWLPSESRWCFVSGRHGEGWWVKKDVNVFWYLMFCVVPLLRHAWMFHLSSQEKDFLSCFLDIKTNLVSFNFSCLFLCFFFFLAHPVQRWRWAEVLWPRSAVSWSDQRSGHHRLCPGYTEIPRCG